MVEGATHMYEFKSGSDIGTVYEVNGWIGK